MADDVSCCQPMFWMYLSMSVALVAFAGLMSGLTLGLMSLSLLDLEVLIKSGQPKDSSNAAKILPVMKNPHLLLCTLLIGNSMAMEALPIFLDALLPAWASIVISVTLILAFGEIIPQAVCTRYGLSVGAKLAWVVQALLWIFFPIAYPIAKLLDWLLGKGHFALMRRAELKTLVDMHGNEAGKGGELTHDETTIISGALDLAQKTAKDAMTPISDTFSLDINSKLDMHTIVLIMNKGHSRVPIFSGTPTNIIGLILVKNLVTFGLEDEVPITSVTIRKIPRAEELMLGTTYNILEYKPTFRQIGPECLIPYSSARGIYDDLPLYDILNEFQKGQCHMAVVIKHTKNTGARIQKSKSNILGSRINRSRKLISSYSFSGVGSQVMVRTSATGAYSPVIRSPVVRGNMEKQGDVHPQPRKLDRGRHDNILDIKSDSLPSYSVDEEVIGIITMEDVMEELLQEEILDETDEYVDVHKKIKINVLPPERSSPRTPRFASLSQFLQRTPTTSPFSPFRRASKMSTFSSSPGRS